MCQHTWGGAFIVLKLMVKANGLLEKMSSSSGFLVKESMTAVPSQVHRRNFIIRTGKEL